MGFQFHHAGACCLQLGTATPLRHSRTGRGLLHSLVILVYVGLLTTMLGFALGLPAWGQSSAKPSLDRDITRSFEFNGQQIFIAADEIVYDDGNNIIRATGNVEIFSGKQHLRAEEILYYQDTETIIANGGVYAVTNEGEEIIAESVNLTNRFTAGEVKDFYLQLTNQGRLAANRVAREGKTYSLHRGVYSACPACEEDPSKPLLWQLRANQVMLDEEEQQIYYRDVFFDVYGMPLLYLPYFRQADPRVKRMSGWIGSGIDGNNLLGLSPETSYFWAMDERKDLTFTPKLHPLAGLSLALDYNQALAIGTIGLEAQGSLLPGFMPMNDELLSGQSDLFEGTVGGDLSLDLSREWRLTAAGQIYSSPDYLHEFGLDSSSIQTSQVHLEGFHDRSYSQVLAKKVQPGRSSIDDATLPAMSLLHSSYDSGPILGQTYLEIETDLRGIFRPDNRDSLRASLRPALIMPIQSELGIDWQAEIAGQIEYYATENATAALPGESGYRIVPYAELSAAYPMVRSGPKYSQYLTPKASLTTSLFEDGFAATPNEDSIGVSIDVTNYDQANRSAGSDVIDTGLRFNYGLEWALFNGERQLAQVEVGQSQHLIGDDMVQARMGRSNSYRNVVGKVSLTPRDSTNISYMFSMDPNTASFDLHDLSFDWQWGNTGVSGSYLYFKPDTAEGSPANQLRANFSQGLFDNWTLTQRNLYDFDDARMEQLGVGLSYRHPCAAIGISYDRFDDASSIDHRITFSLSLDTLGGSSLSRTF